MGEDMPKKCGGYAKDILRMCLGYAGDMLRTYRVYARDIPGICRGLDMILICPRYWDFSVAKSQ